MRFLIILLFLCFGCRESGEILKPEKIADFPIISTGEVVDLKTHLQSGKLTVFDFYADWCPPCKKLDRSLASLKQVYGDRINVLKLDLVNWDSELAKHHQIRDLPYLIVYDELTLFKKGPSNEVLPDLVARLNR